jgi:branched-chain amino acid transport system ATP-binding protein
LTPALRLDAVSKRFGGIVVADSISIELRPGDILGLIGPNGAGKTSLFNLISGVVAPDAGVIELMGTDVTHAPAHQRARRGLARTWQNMRLFGSLSVLQNLLLGSRVYRGESFCQAVFGAAALRRQDAEAAARALSRLASMGLDGVAQLPVGELPYGQQKLVALARALMGEAGVLLLDEPMAGVDGAAYDTIRAVVRDEAAHGRAVCVVEHNVSFIRDLCNDAIFMAQGKLLARGSVAELLASPQLTELYFGA